MAVQHCDVVVVGSGATGGWAAKRLCERGLRVVLLEAGGPPPSNLSLQTAQSHDHPFTVWKGRPFNWFRTRCLGGRMHVWGKRAYRMSDLDFLAGTRGGFGEDWPITYAELAPYYDEVERTLGLTGSDELLPQLPDGLYAGPGVVLNEAERRFKSVVEARFFDRRIIPARLITGDHTIPLDAAKRTGRLDIRTHAVVAEVLFDEDTQRATGVRFVDRVSMTHHEINASTVALCASTIESTRILLNSRPRGHENGLGNSSEMLGRFLMDHTMAPGGVRAMGFLGGISLTSAPSLEELAHSFYIPNFTNLSTKHPDFMGGYGLEGAFGRLSSGPDDPLRRLAAENNGVPFTIGGWGEVLPRPESRVTLNDDVRDEWGIPSVHVDYVYGENEHAMAHHQVSTLTEMLTAVGAEIVSISADLAPPGTSVHEVGTARMGMSPKTSVLNKYNQLWDAKNVFVLDGACFVTSGWQNPTLTMMALAGRACDSIVEQARRGEL